MRESFAVGQGVGFGNSEAGAGNFRCEAEASSETANKSGLAGADVADKLNNGGGGFAGGHRLGEFLAEFQHLLLGFNNHYIIIS